MHSATSYDFNRKIVKKVRQLVWSVSLSGIAPGKKIYLIWSQNLKKTKILEKMLGILKVNHQLSDSVCVSAGAQSRLLNLLGLSEKDIPLELREQFGYSKKHSLILQAVRDTTLKYYRTGLRFKN